MIKVATDDDSPAIDLRAVIPSTEPLNPTPRALLVTGAGNLFLSAPSDLPALPVNEGQLVPVRPLRVLPATTATVIALY